MSTTTGRILVVDDYEPLRYLKSFILTRRGYEVLQAETGAEALSLVEAEKPELVLLDINLPDIHGVDVCRQIRERPESANLPIAFTSAAPIPEELSEAADATLVGADSGRLLSLVEDLLHRSTGQPAARPPQSLPSETGCTTDFAPAERLPLDEVLAQAKLVASSPLFELVLDLIPCAVAVLNEERQIVFANRALLDLAGASDRRIALGLRPGEALQCIRAAMTAGGCGTTEFCQSCGAVRAILEGQLGMRSERECRLTRRAGEEEQSLDLVVSTAPLDSQGRFILCTVADASQEKRRSMLQSLFFHDLLNAAEGLEGLAAEMPALVATGDAARCAERIRDSAGELITQIHSQQQVAEATTAALSVQPASVPVVGLLRLLVEQYSRIPAAHDKALVVDDAAADVELVTDRSLLARVLGNMVKNALEAARPGERVTAGCRATAGAVEFFVHNPGVIPLEARSRVFELAFSTKGSGRGLGSYSMKLLAERYLGGQVGFRSSEAEGTTFYARFPH